MAVNNVDAIIQAIRSRCAEFNFERINKDTMVRRLRYISQLEGTSFSEHQFTTIAEHAQGDLRKAINLMQNMQIDTSDYEGIFGI